VLAAVGELASITLTDNGTLNLTVAQALNDRGALGKIIGPYQVNLLGTGIFITGGGIATASISALLILPVSDASALTSAGYVLTARDAAADIQKLTPSQIGALASLKVLLVTATDKDASLSVAQKSAFGAAGISLAEPWSGGTEQVYTWNVDGSVHDVHYYGVTGKPYTDYAIFYGSNGKVTSESWYNGGTLFRTETWNVAGIETDVHTYAGGTFHGTAYASVESIYSGGSPNLHTEELFYDGAGNVVASETWGYTSNVLTEIDITGITNANYTSTTTLYDSNGQATSESWYNGGTLYRTENWNAAGIETDIHTYVGGTFDGTAYASVENVYSGGSPNLHTEELFHDGAGNVVASETWSYISNVLTEIDITGITNVNYTSTKTLYGSNGKATSESWYIGNGMYETEIFGASNQGISFTPGTNGLLKLDDVQDYTGTVAAFAPGDTIDMAGLAFSKKQTGGTYDAGTGALTVINGTQSATLNLINTIATSFAASSDGHGGTLITSPTALGSGQVAILISGH
jgi:hypothetical protein